MAELINPEQPHDEAEELLAWYATGQIGASERERVETHLAACARCRHQLVLERRFVQEFRSFSPQIESGWTRLREGIDASAREPARASPSITQTAGGLWAAFTRPVVVAVAAAQVAFVAFASALLLWLSQPAYHALGSNPTAASANVIVMFQADATERDLREAVRAAGASVVGGPTAAGAYLVRVEPQRLHAALGSLQSNPKVQLAQPIDSEGGK